MKWCPGHIRFYENGECSVPVCLRLFQWAKEKNIYLFVYLEDVHNIRCINVIGFGVVHVYVHREKGQAMKL